MLSLTFPRPESIPPTFEGGLGEVSLLPLRSLPVGRPTDREARLCQSGCLVVSRPQVVRRGSYTQANTQRDEQSKEDTTTSLPLLVRCPTVGSLVKNLLKADAV